MIRLLLVLMVVLFALPAYAADSATALDDPNALVALVTGHKWVALAAVGIGLIVRLLKSDTTIPIDIPPRLRAPLAIALGAASGAIDKLVEAGNTTWTAALTSGLIAAFVAMIGHNVVIDSARGGKELVVPGLTKTNTPPGPGKPPSIKPAPVVMGALLALFMWGCALFQGAQGAKTELALWQIACIAENAFLDNTALNTVCELVTPAQKAEAAQRASAHRAQVIQKAKAMRAEAVCAPDAGPLAEGGAK